MLETEWFCGKGIEDEESRTACSGARRVAWMIFVCGVGLALLGVIGGCASAALAVDAPVYVHDSSALKAQLLAKPCDDPPVMDMIKANLPWGTDRFKVVEAYFHMRSGEWKYYSGCWAELTEKEVGFPALALLFEDGDFYLVDKAEFLAKPKKRGEVDA